MACGGGLFGQNQLVFTRDTQQVALAGMVDFQGFGPLQQLVAIDARNRGGSVAVGLGRGCLGTHDLSFCK